MGGWTGRRVRDIVHIGDSSFSVTFDLIQEAYKGFFVTGAEWVGIWGIAFSELAKVSLWCVCVWGGGYVRSLFLPLSQPIFVSPFVVTMTTALHCLSPSRVTS